MSFAARVSAELNYLKDNYEYGDDERAFEHWFMALITNKSDYDVSDDMMMGVPGEKGIDGGWVDDYHRRILIFQCTYPGAAFGDRQKLADFAQCYNRLKDKKTTEQLPTSRLRAFAKEYRDRVALGYDVILYFAVFNEVKKSVKDEVVLQNKNMPQRHTLELYDLGRIDRAYRDRKASERPVRGDVRIRIDRNQVFQTKIGSIDALTLTVSAKEISRLVEQFERRLVSKNVRYYLETSAVNKGIDKTLRTPRERPRFWHYNNGITMTCNDFSPQGGIHYEYGALR